MKYWAYKIIVKTDHPEDLENIMRQVDNIKFFRADAYNDYKTAMRILLSELTEPESLDNKKV